MSVKAAAVTICVSMMIAAICLAGENKGAANMELYGGTRGIVPFNHHQHQAVLKDCNVCHTLFPQQKGAIEKLKADGALKKKQIMNKHCIKCHRSKKEAGESFGPITCKQCHIKG